MKKMLCLLLCLLLPCIALAEDAPFGPYDITTPEGVMLLDNEGSFTFVQGETRVVAIGMARVPEDNPAEALIRLMGQFEPGAVIGEDVPLAEGFSGLSAVTPDRFGEGVDLYTCMVLSAQGDLLILSGYDMSGAGENALALLETVLACVTADGASILPEESSAAKEKRTWRFCM